LLSAVVALAVAGPAAAALRLKRIANGLNQPVQVTSFRGDPYGRLYIVEKDGVIRVWRRGVIRRTPFLNIRSLVGSSGGEQGLLGLAFSPRYRSNHYFWVYYTNVYGNIRVARFRSNGYRGLPSTRRVRIKIAHPGAENHNGGQLAFGPDGRLYIGVGDGGFGCDPNENGQHLSSRLGKILRLNTAVAGSTPRIAEYGVRNPWRFSFDRATGDLYVGDVGQDSWEEVDFIGSLTRLFNLGWDVYEGNQRDTCSHGSLNSAGTLKFPVAVYDHGAARCSITGGFVYRGAQIPRVRGWYFYGDFCSGEIWRLKMSSGKLLRGPWQTVLNVSNLSSFGEGPKGGLFLVSLSGQVYKLAGS
jgi:glucose/arabinose dehydrogenase